MNNKKDELKIVYDREADVLYVTRGQPEYTDYVEYADDLILRFHPGTKQLVGFTLVDFSRHFAKNESDIALPFGVDFHMHGELLC
ncbi:MAG: DUF2283 domain-containing protein [Candidatus Poribacteria bacterium]|nr:DUF2283 domain-containing protein [Candidatus Poribacteria bacterium]